MERLPRLFDAEAIFSEAGLFVDGIGDYLNKQP